MLRLGPRTFFRRSLLLMFLAFGISYSASLIIDAVLHYSTWYQSWVQPWFSAYKTNATINGEGTATALLVFKTLLYSLCSIVLCLIINRNIDFLPQLDFRFLRNLILSCCIGLGLGALLWAYVSYANGAHAREVLADLSIRQAYHAGFPLLLVFTVEACVIGPFAEEFVFRGIMPDYSQLGSEWQTALISVAAFAFAHFQIGGTAALLNAAVTGSVYFIVRRQCGHFGYAALCHGFYNLTQVY